jgi:peptidase M23-like protein
MRLPALSIMCSLAASTAAGELVLQMPIDCTLGETCHIQQFPDHDPGPGARDYLCGTLSYDGHKGTDFALPYHSDMEAGVNVLAAADGVVRGVRDGMSDQVASPANAASFADKECGNGVVLRHPDGWETQYCHMKRGSVAVRSGDKVQAGAVLGQVGLSGKTQFPHVHLSVRQNGQVVDPFSPDALATCSDSAPERSLWASVPDHSAGGFIGGGFSTDVPDFDDIKRGTADRRDIATSAPALVFWSFLYGSQAGDALTLTLDGPEGRVAEYDDALTRTQAQSFRAAGRRLRGDGWPAGTYVGIAVLTRDGAEIDRYEAQIEIR